LKRVKNNIAQISIIKGGRRVLKKFKGKYLYHFYTGEIPEE